MRSLCILSLVIFPLGAQQAIPATSQAITLSQAIAHGRVAGLRNTLAQLGIRQAAAHASTLASSRLPSATLNLSAERQTVNLDEFGLDLGPGGTTDPFSLFRGRIGFRQLLFDRPNSDRIRMAQDSQATAGDDARRIGEQAAAVAGGAWLRLLSAVETVRARENDSVTAVSLRDIAGAQVAAGTAAQIELTRSESQLAIVRSQLALARLAVERSRVDLARALDLPAASLLQPEGEPILSVITWPANADSAVALAWVNRSDLAAERGRAALTEAAVDLIRHQFWPTANAQGYAQSSGTDLGRMSTSWNLGVGVSWALFDGYGRQRRLDEQLLRSEAQAARVADLQQQIEVEARQATLDLASAREQLSLAQERVRLAEQEMTEAGDRLLAGVTGTTETTRAQGQLAAARDFLIQTRVMMGAAHLGVAAATGLLDQIN